MASSYFFRTLTIRTPERAILLLKNTPVASADPRDEPDRRFITSVDAMRP
jgi:hypothetical protein